MNGKVKKLLLAYAKLKCPEPSRLVGRVMKSVNIAPSEKDKDVKTIKNVTICYEGERQFYQELKRSYNRGEVDLDTITKELADGGITRPD